MPILCQNLWNPRPAMAGCAAVAVLVASGCATFHDQPLAADLELQKFAARTPNDPELRAFVEDQLGTRLPVWPPTAWDLDGLSLIALHFHSDLAVARAQLAVARAGRVVAGQRPNPSVKFTPTYNATTAPPWILGLSFDIPIETAGKRGLRVAQAEQREASALASLQAAAWRVRSRVRRALVAFQAAGAAEEILTRRHLLQQEVVRLRQSQLALGAVARPEVSQAEVVLQQAAVAVTDARQQTELARVGLASALGLPTAAIADLPLAPPAWRVAPEPLPDAEIRRAAMLARADLRAALADYGAAQAALELEIAKQYPDVNLGPGYQLDQTSNLWTLSFGLPLPILNRNEGRIAEAEARRSESAANFLALQSRVIAEVDAAVAVCGAAVARARSAEQMVRELVRQADIAAGMFEAGALTRPELLLRQIELASGELQALRSLADVQDALAGLEAALQNRAGDASWPVAAMARSSLSDSGSD